MKNKIFITLCLILFSITGCGKNEKSMTCTSTEDLDGETMNLKYTISYNDDYVTTVNQIIEIEFDDLDEFSNDKDEIIKMCKTFNNFKYIECSSNLKNKIFRYEVNFDFEKIDFDELIDSGLYNYEMRSSDGKIHLNDLVNSYKLTGMTCK